MKITVSQSHPETTPVGAQAPGFPPRPAKRRAQTFVSALLSSAALGALLCGCGTAKVSSRHEISAAPAARPVMIYVANFDLDAADIRSERGMLPAPPKLPGLGDLLPPLPGTAKDPRKLANELVESMTASLVKDLKQAGLNARRLNSTNFIPASGWLVRGVFTDVNQGNQLTRAMIGLGAGKTDLQVLIDINDLSQGAPRPFYQLTTTADSGKAPGAAPTIVLGPAGAAARFVIAGKDLNKNVKQTASKIAAEVVQRTGQAPDSESKLATTSAGATTAVR